MTHVPSSIRLSPSRITWIGLSATLLIAAAVGIAGTSLVLHYLQGRLIAHGMEHNREFARAVTDRARRLLETPGDAPETPERVGGLLDAYRGLGYRLFLLDLDRLELVADTGAGDTLPARIAQTWLAEATTLEQRPIDWRQAQGGARHQDPNGTIHLLWFEALGSDRPLAGRWILGVSRDQKLLHDFMGEAQLQLDAVLVLTYVLIAVIGYFIVRGLGRAYERTLEVQVAERTEALRIAHSEMLAKTRLATIGQTAAMLAHEMRNPLASIKLALSALAGSPTLGDREGRRVDLVLGEVDRLNALLSETLDYVRPIDLSADPIALDRLIDETLQLEEPSLAEKALNLSRVLCESCAPIRLDGAQMRQVLLNLLRNAIEASPVGGTIRIATRCEGDDLVLEIVNPAEAIDDQALGRAFEPFYSTKARGTGLGLGLVKRVVEEHGGRIRLDADGQEVQVEIRLPLRGP